MTYDSDLETREVGYIAMSNLEMETAEDNSTYSIVLNVDSVLNCERDDPPTDEEQQLIDICKQAKSQSISDLIIYED